MSAGVVRLMPRAEEVQALRIILGATTRSQIMEFCPEANVGVSTHSRGGQWVDNEYDIRWVIVPGVSQMSHDGEWLVKLPGNKWQFLTDPTLWERYREL